MLKVLEKPKAETKLNRHHKRPGYARRLSLANIFNVVVAYGQLSDQAVIEQGRSEGLYHDRAFNEHQRRFRGSLQRLRKQNPFMLKIPPKVEAARLASAMKATQGER